jgi:hypothetical protein
VFFPEASKVGVKEIKEMSEKMREEGVARAILVVAANLTPFARSVVADMQGKQVMEVFTEAELLVNITKHTLVPSHRILSPEEKATLLARYKVKESQLPRIQVGGERGAAPCTELHRRGRTSAEELSCPDAERGAGAAPPPLLRCSGKAPVARRGASPQASARPAPPGPARCRTRWRVTTACSAARWCALCAPRRRRGAT